MIHPRSRILCYNVILQLFLLSLVASTLVRKIKDEGFQALASWMKLHGGRVDQRMDITEMNGIRGAIALADIEEGTELLHCPWKLVIGSSSLQEQMQSQDMCTVVQTMAAEFRLGQESLWFPYLDHIDLPRLAAMWDVSAVDELQGLAPSEDVTRHLKWFSQSCHHGGDEMDDQAMHQALVSFITRASAVGMIPIYDLLNHHNGERNAKLFLNEEGVQLVAMTPIRQGTQLFLSYGVKTSSTMYRDYGFVDEWPSVWNWKDTSSGDNHVFVCFPDGIVAIHPSADFLKQIWHSSGPLVQFQESATKHTQALTRESLIRFGTAARILLDELPTTLQQDADILVRKKASLAQMISLTTKGKSSDEEKSIVSLEDIIKAIEYRITFKEAVQSALSVSESARRRIEDDENSNYDL